MTTTITLIVLAAIAIIVAQDKYYRRRIGKVLDKLALVEAERDELLAQAAIPPAIQDTLSYALREVSFLDGDTSSVQAAKAWLKQLGRGGER